MRLSRLTVLAVAVALGSANGTILASPVGTRVTYQGQLKAGGVPADGHYDFVFRLYDADTGGAQVGGDVTLGALLINDGLFTAELDFGPGVFTGDALWLQVAVRDSDVGGLYTNLSPRQPLNAAPYALYALDGPGSSGFWAASGNNIHNANSGGVGIGTSTPAWELEVANYTPGEGAESGVTANDAGGAVAAYSSTLAFPFEHFGGRVSLLSNAGTLGLDLRADATDGDIRFYTGGAATTNEKMRITASGAVGIGTDEPMFDLHVFDSGSGSFHPPARIGTHFKQYGFPTYEDWFTVEVGGDRGELMWGAGTRLVRNSGTGLYFQTEDQINSAFRVSQMVLDANGRLGIGTIAPQEKLHVDGSILADGSIRSFSPNEDSEIYIGWGTDGGGTDMARIRIGGDGPGATNGLDIQRPGNVSLVRVTNAGEVGIGTTQPEALLHVTTAYGQSAKFTQSGTGVGVSITTTNPSSNYAALSVSSWSNNAPALSVSGTASVDVLEIYGADVAERFPASEHIEPGTVVEIDPDHPGALRVARGVYNRRVAGVASGAGDIPAGTILGNLPGQEDAPAIALSGRVWVRCDATLSEIVVGDMLTSSDTPGHAMAVRDFSRAHGAVIGKAMTPLAKGETGLVLVLVNLQ